jgi:DNA-binding NarL/FixJ family response regulator
MLRVEPGLSGRGHPAVGHARPRQSRLRAAQDDASVPRPIRVLVSSESYLTRECLASILTAAAETELVAVCAAAQELEAAIEAVSPEVVLTDMPTAPSGGWDRARVAIRLRETSPDMGVVVLSRDAEPSLVLAVLDKGTARRAYLLTERIRSREELIGPIEAVARGGSALDPLIVDALVQARARAMRSRLSKLTPRESEVLAEVARGKSNGSIAESLTLTKRAIEKHINSIFSKLDLGGKDMSRRVRATRIFLSEAGDTEAQVSALTEPAIRADLAPPG